jgi:hypothetical protein
MNFVLILSDTISEPGNKGLTRISSLNIKDYMYFVRQCKHFIEENRIVYCYWK